MGVAVGQADNYYTLRSWLGRLWANVRTNGVLTTLATKPYDLNTDHYLEIRHDPETETYPAEFYTHFGFAVRKRDQESRRAASVVLLAWAAAAGVRLTSEPERQLLDGFGAGPAGEDAFDAVVGLFGMLNVILGYRLPGDPADDTIRQVEGWMLGMA